MNKWMDSDDGSWIISLNMAIVYFAAGNLYPLAGVCWTGICCKGTETEISSWMVIGRFTRTRTTSATNLSLLLLSNDMVAAVAVVSGWSPTSPLPPPPVPGLHLGHTMEDVMGKFNHFNYYHYERDKFLFVAKLLASSGRQTAESSTSWKQGQHQPPTRRRRLWPSVGKIRRTFNVIVNWHRPPSLAQDLFLAWIREPPSLRNNNKRRSSRPDQTISVPLLVYIKWKIKTMFVDVSDPSTDWFHGIALRLPQGGTRTTLDRPGEFVRV